MTGILQTRYRNKGVLYVCTPIENNAKCGEANAWCCTRCNRQKSLDKYLSVVLRWWVHLIYIHECANHIMKFVAIVVAIVEVIINLRAGYNTYIVILSINCTINFSLSSRNIYIYFICCSLTNRYDISHNCCFWYHPTTYTWFLTEIVHRQW